MKFLAVFFAPCLIFVGLVFSSASVAEAQTPPPQTLTTINGMNAYVHLPDNYNQTGTQKYPLIIFFPGLGEVGTDASKLLFYGPSKFVADGHAMQFMVNGTLERPIVISLQPIVAWPAPSLIDNALNTIISQYRVDETRISLTGLSMGGWMVNNYIRENSQYASRIAGAMVMQTPVFERYEDRTWFAQQGSRWWGIEGADDFRSMDFLIQNVFNAAKAGSAKFTKILSGQTGSTHCCWNTFYDPNWTDGQESIYVWMLKQRNGGQVSVPITSPGTLTANAGPDQVSTNPQLVVLSGSGNNTNGGTITSYQWSKISGPSQYYMLYPTSATNWLNSLVSGTYVFRLTVTDNQGNTAFDDVQLTMNVPVANKAPTANAGQSQTITLPTSTVTLSGSATDADGTIASYQWTKVSGPTLFTITSPAAAATQITGLAQGTYVFRLTATDDKGATGTADVTVIVSAQLTPSTGPVVNAGPDQISDNPLLVVLSGSATDTETITSYQWTKVSGPAQFNILSPNAASTWMNSVVPGTYVFRLTATNSKGATGFDDVQLMVKAPLGQNQPPTSRVGADQSITLPTSSVTLSGADSFDSDGSITNYAWVLISGRFTPTIVTPASASTVVTGLTASGTYVFRLTVTDNGGATASIDTTVIVKPDPNQIVGQAIKITGDMIINERVLGDETKLFDESHLLILDANRDPLQTLKPKDCGSWWEQNLEKICWNPADTNANKAYLYPGALTINLGQMYTITEVYIFNKIGPSQRTNDILEFWSGTPFNFTKKITGTKLDGSSSGQWKRLPVTQIDTQYIRMLFTEDPGHLAEVVIMGSPIGQAAAKKQVTPIAAKHTFDRFLGTNIIYGMGNGIKRQYDHQWGTVRWFGSFPYTFDKNTNLPNPINDGFVEGVFSRATASGAEIFFTQMGTAKSMVDPTHPSIINDTWNPFTDRKPIDYSLCAGTRTIAGIPNCEGIAEKPESYAKRAWMWKKYAAIDGGLSKGGRITSVETGNENDGGWYNAGYFQPYELAAMMSADYDGHCNTLTYNGEGNLGIKNGNPKMKVYMPGLANHDYRYLRAMQHWFEYYRPCSPKFPADVVNVHAYPTTIGFQYLQAEGAAVAPEQFGLREKMKKIVDFRNEFAPHAEVANTEFGVDSYPEKHINPENQYCGKVPYANSWLAPRPFGPYDEQELQGQWLARDVLEMFGAGMDLVNQYWLADTLAPGQACDVFNASGLFSIAGNEPDNVYVPIYKPRPSWFYFQTLRNRLMGMKLASEKNVPNGLGSGTFRVQKYQSVNDASKKAYVIWSPTMNAVVNNSFALTLDKAAKATVVEMLPGTEVGSIKSSSATFVNIVTLPVSERPTIVVADESGTTPIETPVPVVNAQVQQTDKGSSPVIVLTATATVTGGSIEEYRWVQISGPNTGHIQDPVRAITEVTKLTAGTYTFEITVTSNTGQTAKDRISITVTSSQTPTPPATTPPNNPPPTTPVTPPNNIPPTTPSTSPSSFGPSTPTVPITSTERVKVNVNSTLAVRSSPGGTLVARAKDGVTGTVIERGPKVAGVQWVKVQFAANMVGWVVDSYLVPLAPAATPTQPATPPSNNTSSEQVKINVRSTLAVRSSPNGPLIAKAKGGVTGTVIERGQKVAGVQWVKVRLSDGTVGWVVDTYLIPLPAATTVNVRVTAQSLNVRATPNGILVGKVPLNTTGVIISNAADAWVKVQFSNGVQGYVSKAYIRNY